MTHTDSTFSVVIVGGGFCGVMTLVNLISKTKKEAFFALIHKGHPFAKGIAYQTYSNLHLLNVEVRNMSAFPDQPDHFLDWCLKQNDITIHVEDLPFSYLPRNIYGRYLTEIFENSCTIIPSHIKVQIIEDEVSDLDKENQRLLVKTKSGNSIIADKVLLATGNFEPRPPAHLTQNVLRSNKYFSNPWCEHAVNDVKVDDTILIIGTGLTMVDVVLGLNEKKFNGKILALSPHGYKILPHRKLPLQRYILDELSPPYELEKLFRLFYRHVREARKRGLSGETVVDAIRARTQEIWQLLSKEDKKKFMTHLRHLWGVARHRLPAYVHENVQNMIAHHKLDVIAGRIIEVCELGHHIDVRIRRRKDQSEETIRVARIINCTGPESDIRKQSGELFLNLLKKGLVCSDDMNLGIEASARGEIIDASKKTSDRIFALGSLLKGKLWESTAIPELRRQANDISDMIHKSLEGDRHHLSRVKA